MNIVLTFLSTTKMGGINGTNNAASGLMRSKLTMNLLARLSTILLSDSYSSIFFW